MFQEQEIERKRPKQRITQSRRSLFRKRGEGQREERPFNGHQDLLTRSEAAAYLRVSRAKLAQGWGPPPLQGFFRPMMYSKTQCDEFLDSLRSEWSPSCSTAAQTQPSGGRNSKSGAVRFGARRESEIAEKLRFQLVASK